MRCVFYHQDGTEDHTQILDRPISDGPFYHTVMFQRQGLLNGDMVSDILKFAVNRSSSVFPAKQVGNLEIEGVAAE
jgi:hypothetical protein